MAQPFLGEIKIMSFNFAPQGWAMCNGQFLPINQNQALFSLLGTMYGGNGQTTFALPDLRGQVPIHFNKNVLGSKGGQPAHTLTMAEMTAHNHFVNASSSQADSTFIQTAAPASQNVFGTVAGGIYAGFTNVTAMLPESITNVGGSQPHENRQPYLVLNFCIALVGVFPSRN